MQTAISTFPGYSNVLKLTAKPTREQFPIRWIRTMQGGEELPRGLSGLANSNYDRLISENFISMR
jgi:hypothetical protein